MTPGERRLFMLMAQATCEMLVRNLYLTGHGSDREKALDLQAEFAKAFKQIEDEMLALWEEGQKEEEDQITKDSFRRGRAGVLK